MLRHNKMLISILMLCALTIGWDDEPPVTFGFASVEITRLTAGYNGRPAEIAPGVVIRFESTGKAKIESLAVSNHAGIAKVPLRPGTYCYDTFDQTGKPLEIAPDRDRCFEIEAHKTTHIWISLAFEKDDESSEREPSISIGFANVIAVHRLPEGGQPKPAPATVLRFNAEGGKGESFATTYYDGIAVVPFRPGRYCYAPYNYDGHALEFSSLQGMCFEIRRNRFLTVGLSVVTNSTN